MANSNMNKGMATAANYPQLQVQFIRGKNPKQAVKTIVNGIEFKTSALHGTDWDEFFAQFTDGADIAQMSMAKSKVEHGHGENANIRQVHKLEQLATYVKKDIYNYKNMSLPVLIDYILQDFGYSIDFLKTFSGFDIDYKNLIYYNNKYYVPCAVDSCVGQWFNAHDEWKKYKNMSFTDLLVRYEQFKNDYNF